MCCLAFKLRQHKACTFLLEINKVHIYPSILTKTLFDLPFMNRINNVRKENSKKTGRMGWRRSAACQNRDPVLWPAKPQLRNQSKSVMMKNRQCITLIGMRCTLHIRAQNITALQDWIHLAVITVTFADLGVNIIFQSNTPI